MNAQDKHESPIVLKFMVDRDPASSGTITYNPKTKEITVRHEDTELCGKIINFYHEYTPPVVIDDEEWDEDGNIRRVYKEVTGFRGIDDKEYFMRRSSELYGELDAWIDWGNSECP